jgi:multidrug efflux system membrane fusion protein
LAAGCGGRTAPEPAPTPVRVATVAAAAGGSGARYAATITPLEQVDLAFKVSGYVEEIRQVRGLEGRRRDLQDGDRVPRGAMLARVRDGEYRDRLNQARANLAEAEAVLVRAVADRDRARVLYERQSLTRPDFDAAESQHAVAQARVEAARAALDMARTALEDCTLRAPIDGVILGHSVEAGELVSPGLVAFVVADTTSVKATFGVSDVRRGGLREGMALSIRTEVFPAEDFHGRITRIAASADPKSRVFEVEVTLPNTDGRLRSGMIASLQTADGEPEEALPAVPLGAIVRPPGRAEGYAVFAVAEEEGRSVARLREVVLGEALGNSIAVTSGLSVGERIVVTGATLVVDGAPVRVVP